MNPWENFTPEDTRCSEVSAHRNQHDRAGEPRNSRYGHWPDPPERISIGPEYDRLIRRYSVPGMKSMSLPLRPNAQAWPSA